MVIQRPVNEQGMLNPPGYELHDLKAYPGLHNGNLYAYRKGNRGAINRHYGNLTGNIAAEGQPERWFGVLRAINAALTSSCESLKCWKQRKLSLYYGLILGSENPDNQFFIWFSFHYLLLRNSSILCMLLYISLFSNHIHLCRPAHL